MSLPVGKAIYLIAFSPPLVLITQTHRPACHPYSLCLFMLIIYVYICFFQNFIFTFVSFLNQCIIKILNVMEKYYLCSVQSKTNPNQNKTVLVPVEDISAFVSSCMTPDCVILVSNCSTFNKLSNEK